MFYILKFKKHEDLFEEGETQIWREREMLYQYFVLFFRYIYIYILYIYIFFYFYLLI